jgi:hypothetical protein
MDYYLTAKEKGIVHLFNALEEELITLFYKKVSINSLRHIFTQNTKVNGIICIYFSRIQNMEHKKETSLNTFFNNSFSKATFDL